MAIAVHVLIDGSQKATKFTKLADAIAELNVASFAGIGGVAVVAVGRTDQEATDRVEDFMELEE